MSWDCKPASLLDRHTYSFWFSEVYRSIRVFYIDISGKATKLKNKRRSIFRLQPRSKVCRLGRVLWQVWSEWRDFIVDLWVDTYIWTCLNFKSLTTTAYMHARRAGKVNATVDIARPAWNHFCAFFNYIHQLQSFSSTVALFAQPTVLLTMR